MNTHGVTCRTDGCENNGYTILLFKPGHSIICGPCGKTITDISPPLPDDPYEYLPPNTELVG